MKIVRTDRELETPHLDAELIRQGADLVLLPDCVSEADLTGAIRDADLLLMCYTPITARIIDAAERLNGIVKYGVGIDAIDIKAAMAKGVPVVNIPEYAEETVAEGAFAMMIALAKKLMPIAGEVQRTGWAWPTGSWLGVDIAGSTVGLVGTGRIGKSMARMAGAGFKARVIGYDPYVAADEMRAAGIIKFDDLTTMLAESDIVSVHSVLNDETRHLIGETEFAVMKPTALLINVSRGAIVDEDAMVRVLTEGRIAGAGLDVYSREPLAVDDHPLSALFGLPNVILFPHLTFYTAEAMMRLEQETLDRCGELLRGEPVLIKSCDPRLRAQSHRVRFEG